MHHLLGSNVAKELRPTESLPVGNLHTARGKARVDGLASTRCPFSIDSPLLGVIMRKLSFFEGFGRGGDGQRPVGAARSAVTLRGQGFSEAVIQFDIIARPEQAQFDDTAFGSGQEVRPSRSGKLRRQKLICR